MALTLPDEVWSLVAWHVAREAETTPTNEAGMRVRARQPGEQWQILADRHESVHPLMVMAWVCRRWRRIATPMLWTNVVLDIHDDYDSMDLLIQLSEALQLGTMAARCITTLNIDVRRTLDESRMLAMDQMEEEFERIMQEDCGNITTMPDLAAFDATLDRLGLCLAKCEKLTHFGWRGDYRPTASFFKSISTCKSLASVTLDVGDACLFQSFQGYPATDDPLDFFKDTISRAALGMGAYSQAMQARVACNEAGVYNDMRASDENRCRGLEAWLASPNKLKQLVLGAPILYAQPWLLPLWAQLDKLRDSDDPAFGERLSEADAPYAKAAQQFRSRLMAARVAAPRDVYELIQSDDAFYPWRSWFPDWGHEETRATMAEVLERLSPQ